MSNTTSRLSLVEPVTTDAPSVLRTAITTNATTLDGAVIESSGTVAGRPSASLYGGLGQFYYATDAGVPFVSYNSTWNAIDLTPVSTAVSASAVDGQAVVVTGSSAVTITLPSHQSGQIVAVTNFSTGGTTVSGSPIYGVGLSSVSSFALGTVGSSVLLIDDGTNWRIVAGQQDTGWVTLPVNSGVTTYAGTPASRLVGDRVYLRGTLSVGAATGGYTLATLATTFRPASQVYYPGAINNSGTQQPAFFQIFTSGVISVPQAISTTTYIPLDGVNYCIS